MIFSHSRYQSRRPNVQANIILTMGNESRIVLRKPYCGMRSKRVGVHFFRQISVSTTLLNRGRVYASRLPILSTQ